MQRKIKTSQLLLPTIALAGLVFAITSVMRHPVPKRAEPITLPPMSTFDHTVAGIGVVEPRSELITIGVELPGVVREVAVKVGDSVKKGDVLFTIDQRDIDAQIAVLEKSLIAANIQAQDAAAQFALVSTIKDSRAISKDDFNRRKYGNEFAAAKAAEIGAQLELAKTTKERLTIRAPMTGEVLEVNVRSGQYANAGISDQPLMLMGDVSTLHVRVEVDEENSAHISPKSEAYGLKRGDTTTKYPLTFDYFEPYVRPKQNLTVSGQRVDTRVLQIVYSLPKGEKNIFVGAQMDVFIKEGL